MNIYLISLQKDFERRNALKNIFFHNYARFKIIDAIDGRTLSAKEYFDLAHTSATKFNRLLSPSELGCSLSHIKALETFLKSGENHALILEDDIIGRDEDIQKIESLLPYIPKNSILMCGGQDKISLRRYLYGKKMANSLNKLANFSHFYIVRACCYVVTRSSAAAILATQREYVLLADSWYHLIKDKNIEIFFADILVHPDDDTKSNLHHERNIITLDRRSFRQKWLSIQTLKSLSKRLKLYKNIVLSLLLGYKKV